MKFRIKCDGRTKVVEIENNALTTVNDLKTAILTSALEHSSSDIRLSLNGSTPLDENSTLSDSGLVHGDAIYVMIPPGATCNISPSSSSTSQQLGAEASGSTSASSSKVEVNASSEQSTESCNDCNIDQGSSETMMACGDADAGQDDAAIMQTDEGMADVVEINRYLNEPMLIRESTEKSLPQSLVKLYGELKEPGSFRALAVVLKVLMNEVGYMDKDKAVTLAAIRNWTCPDTLTMRFDYPGLDETVFSLLVVPIRETVVVHGCANVRNHEMFYVTIDAEMSEFVNNCMMSGDPCTAFRGERLPALSRTFKDGIAYRLLNSALPGYGFSGTPTLATLPLELQMEVMKRLDVASLLRLSEVCHQLHNAAQDRSVWRHRFVKDFGASRISVKDLTEDWKSMYSRRYKSHKALTRPYKIWRPEPPFPPIVPIGGEYDLNPFFPGRRPPMGIGGPVIFPFSNGSSLDTFYDESLLPSVRPAFRHGHRGGARGGPFCFRF